MTDEKGAPLWASLFGEPGEARTPPAPWYKKEAGVWKGLSWPLPVCDEEPWEERHYVALDVETTGLNAELGNIVEIALVRFFFDEEGALSEEDRFSALINPGVSIPVQASRIHGITGADVANAPLFRDMAQKIAETCGQRVIVGHNVLFDVGFLEKEFERAGIGAEFQECADTFGMAKLAFPSMLSYNLGKLAFAIGLQSDAQHRALGDALTCMRLFAASIRILTDKCRG
jgi:DNA polymerase III epsilon subunit family exonuclease